MAETEAANTKTDKTDPAGLELRIKATCALIGTGKDDDEIMQIIAKQFGCSPLAAKDCLARAREALMARLNRPRAVLRAESIAFYEAALADPKTTHSDRLYARKQLGRLSGTPNGPPV